MTFHTDASMSELLDYYRATYPGIVITQTGQGRATASWKSAIVNLEDRAPGGVNVTVGGDATPS